MCDEENRINQALGQRIKAQRHLMQKTQMQVGNALGVTFQQIQKYERGTNRISAVRLKILATFLETTTTYLVGEEKAALPLLTRGECTMLKRYRHLSKRNQKLCDGVIEALLRT